MHVEECSEKIVGRNLGTGAADWLQNFDLQKKFREQLEIVRQNTDSHIPSKVTYDGTTKSQEANACRRKQWGKSHTYGQSNGSISKEHGHSNWSWRGWSEYISIGEGCTDGLGAWYGC